jgi:hypothetical protein
MSAAKRKFQLSCAAATKADYVPLSQSAAAAAVESAAAALLKTAEAYYGVAPSEKKAKKDEKSKKDEKEKEPEKATVEVSVRYLSNFVRFDDGSSGDSDGHEDSFKRVEMTVIARNDEAVYLRLQKPLELVCDVSFMEGNDEGNVPLGKDYQITEVIEALSVLPLEKTETGEFSFEPTVRSVTKQGTKDVSLKAKSLSTSILAREISVFL